MPEIIIMVQEEQFHLESNKNNDYDTSLVFWTRVLH